jgi:hypothetical protein
MEKSLEVFQKQLTKDGVRSVQRSIQSLNKRIAEHLAKIAKDPNSKSINHWQEEIKTFKTQVEAATKVLKDAGHPPVAPPPASPGGSE